jgi:LCP family protein required for cell wall assembly
MNVQLRIREIVVMDEATRQNTPENQTQPVPPDRLPEQRETHETLRGVSESELTQAARPVGQVTEPVQPARRDAAFSEPPTPPYRPQPSVPAPRPPTVYSPVPVAHRRTARPPRQRNNWLLVFVAIVLLGAAITFSVGALVIRRLADVADNAAFTPSAEVAVVSTPTPGTPAPTPTVGLAIQPWDGKHRLTILLMGLDKRPAEKGTAFRTDSIIVFSIDPATRSVGLLSIPRDLFVDIPTDTVVRVSYGLQRVNAAYVIGELARPGYGPQLAMQTVQYNLGMRINHYVVFEFGTVINVVDAVGGIDIDVPYAINDPAYPNMYFGYDPLYIPAGHIHMNGDLALKYARTRHQTSDFDRAKRQQQVIMAVRDKILNLGMAPTLIARAPELWSQISQTTRSDLTFEQLLQLALYLKDVPKENIHQGVIDVGYVSPVNWQGAAVLVPERATIGPLLVKIFGPNYNS